MSDNGRDRKGIIYIVVAILTLVVAVVGATFAYFMATQTNTTSLTGNAATINFGLKVERDESTDQTNGGLIPMSNTMVEQAVKHSKACVDDNGNSVCQIYKITLTNESSASMFLDGYVTLTNTTETGTSTDDTTAKTTMRWAQVFKTGSTYSTGGTTGLNADTEKTFANLDNKADATGMSKTKIYSTAGGYLNTVTDNAAFAGNSRQIISTNYIRTSKHVSGKYDRAKDMADALVYNQYLRPNGDTTNKNVSILYIVVWLHETGTNQTIDTTGSSTATNNFFSGTVTFNSAQGGEVSATFGGYTTVPSDQRVGQ